MDTGVSLKKFDNLLAIRSRQGRLMAFNSESLEIAQISEEAWSQGLRLPELREWNQELGSEAIKENHQFRAITINVTQVCNLHCTYCAAGGDGSFGDPIKKITIEKTFPQIQFFLKKLEAGSEFRLTFLGGEPMLYPEAILMLAEYAQSIAAEKQIRCQFVVVTNGTQFSEKNIEILKQIKANITVSIDGNADINDLLRPTKGGQGATRSIIKGLHSLLEHKTQLGRIGLSGVFGARNMNLESAYRFYSEFNVDWFDFTYDHLETRPEINQEFTAALLKIADLAYVKGGEQELRRIKIFDQYFQSFDSKKKNLNYCGAGKTFLMIDARNQIYTCPWVVGDKAEIVGSGTVLDSAKLAAYNQDLVEQNNCHSCWARNVCGGGCMFIHKNKTGDKHQVDSNFCNRTRDLITASLLYYEDSRSQDVQAFEPDEIAVVNMETAMN